MSSLWRRPANPTCCGSGKAWATTAARGKCTPPPGRLCRTTRGQFPCEFDAVRQLPGIGRYTAGAILSIAFDAAHPILEANTIRLLSRLWAYRGNTHDRKGQMLLWNAAASLLSARGNGELNQALMELGSLICTPRNPKCEACPLESLCPTRKLGVAGPNPGPTAQRRRSKICAKRPSSCNETAAFSCGSAETTSAGRVCGIFRVFG